MFWLQAAVCHIHSTKQKTLVLDLHHQDFLVSTAFHRLRYVGSEQTGSDTAFQYQLAVVTVNPFSADMDYNFENGTCSKMTVRDLGVSVCEWSNLYQR
jgi:hypothetical protein